MTGGSGGTRWESDKRARKLEACGRAKVAAAEGRRAAAQAASICACKATPTCRSSSPSYSPNGCTDYCGGVAQPAYGERCRTHVDHEVFDTEFNFMCNE